MSEFESELARLNELREKGQMTQEEFDAAKARLLGQSSAAGATVVLPSIPAAAPPSHPQLSDDIPPGIKGWSWGAFLWNWIWAIFNNTWIGLLALIPGVNIVMIFVLGAKGREWAWKNKKWDSVEHFNRVQRKWSLWGVWLLIASFVLGILLAAASFYFLSSASSTLPSGSDFMKEIPSGEATDASTAPVETTVTPTEESTGDNDNMMDDAQSVIEENTAPATPAETPSEQVSDQPVAAQDTAAMTAASDEAKQQQAELAKMRAEAAAAKAEAAKAKRDAQKAEKALVEQRRRQEEERMAAEAQAAKELECPYSSAQPLTCSSVKKQPAYCDWNFRACGNPRIAKKESKTTCEGKVQWDTGNNQLVVVEGCRAQFVPAQ